MSVEFRALFMGVALVLFLVAAWDELGRTANRPKAIGLMALGLAFLFFPAFWDAMDAALEG